MAERWDPDDGEDEDEFGPDSPDYDLSEAHGYSWEPRRSSWPPPQWLMVAISLLVVLALLVPGLLLLLRS